MLGFVSPSYGQKIFNYGTTVGPFVTGVEALGPNVPGTLDVSIGAAALFYRGSRERPPFRLNLVPVRVEIGVARNVQLSLRWDVRQRVEKGGVKATGPGDLVVSSKFQFLQQRPRFPAVGLVVSTKLPNASDKGVWLGTDNTDFFSSLLVGSGSWTVNLGLAILGSPVDPPLDSSNDDFLMFGFAWRSSDGRRWKKEVEVSGFVSNRRREDYVVAIFRTWFPVAKGEAGLVVRKGLTRDAEFLGVMTAYRLPVSLHKRSSP